MSLSEKPDEHKSSKSKLFEESLHKFDKYSSRKFKKSDLNSQLSHRDFSGFLKKEALKDKEQNRDERKKYASKTFDFLKYYT